MPECTCGTICSSGEPPRSSFSSTWPIFLITMMPDGTFQKRYLLEAVHQSLLSRCSLHSVPFCSVAIQSGTKSWVWMGREPPALWSPQASSKVHKLLEGRAQPCYLHQLTAQCPSILVVFSGGQKLGTGWVVYVFRERDVNIRRKGEAWSTGRRSPTILPGPGPAAPFSPPRSCLLYCLVLPVLAQKERLSLYHVKQESSCKRP